MEIVTHCPQCGAVLQRPVTPGMVMDILAESGLTLCYADAEGATYKLIPFSHGPPMKFFTVGVYAKPTLEVAVDA